MHENLKAHMDKAFLWFYKVYIYRSNTKKPWNELTQREREAKTFKWDCVKIFMMANGAIIKEDIDRHMEICPEKYEYVGGVNKPDGMMNRDWKDCSLWYEIYKPFPLTEYDVKLLINTIGLRMMHFVNVQNKEQGHG